MNKAPDPTSATRAPRAPKRSRIRGGSVLITPTSKERAGAFLDRLDHSMRLNPQLAQVSLLAGGIKRPPHPHRKFIRVVIKPRRHGVVIHRPGARTLWTEGRHAFALEETPAGIIDPKVQLLIRGDSEKHAFTVIADATEHAPRRDGPHGTQGIQEE